MLPADYKGLVAWMSANDSDAENRRLAADELKSIGQ
jgi:hypothetical protein